MSNLEPASTIIRRLGGTSVVAAAVSVHRTRVSSWRCAKEQGGTGGIIPQKHHRPLLDFAAQNSIELKAEDFLSPVADQAEPASTAS